MVSADGDEQGWEGRPLARAVGKPPEDFQRDDLLRLCREREVRVVNLRFPSLDGKLRELRVPVTGRAALDRLLAAGERVDGSSLFPGLFPPGESDLYAVPVYRWAFLDPWTEDELHLVCRFADRSGAPAASTPDNVLAAAAERLRLRAGAELEALAELEHYLILERTDDRFSGRAQRSYQQSAPYVHGRAVEDEILRLAAAVTGRVKYAHSEVGYIDRLDSEEPELDGRRVEQHELELELMPVEDLGCWLGVVRWLIRAVAARRGASVTFVPKLDEGMAGSGMHLHLALFRGAENVMAGADGDLSEDGLAVVGGLLGRAAALTAFGNTVASSYLRLVPGQEAPTRVCWGPWDRESLIRIPLGFDTERRLDLTMNPGEASVRPPGGLARPTVELRSPDGTAFIHLLLAAVTLAVEEGLASGGAERARSSRVASPGANAGGAGAASRFEALPATAVEAARRLREECPFFEERGFPSRLLDHVACKLEAEHDEGLSERLRSLPAAERLRESRRLMHKDLHKH